MIPFGGFGIGYNVAMITLNAHFDGKTIVPDDTLPLPFRSGTRLKVQVQMIDEPVGGVVEAAHFQPLDIRIAPELSSKIALDRE